MRHFDEGTSTYGEEPAAYEEPRILNTWTVEIVSMMLGMLIPLKLERRLFRRVRDGPSTLRLTDASLCLVSSTRSGVR